MLPCPLMPAPGVGPHAPRQRLASAGCRRQAAGSHRSARTGRVTGDGQPARLELLGGRLLGGSAWGAAGGDRNSSPSGAARGSPLARSASLYPA